jgi:hypothetical protein
MNAQEWILSKGVYSCIVEVGGKCFKINASLGILEPTPDDLN